jgi:hypothetical protein
MPRHRLAVFADVSPRDGALPSFAVDSRREYAAVAAGRIELPAAPGWVALPSVHVPRVRAFLLRAAEGTLAVRVGGADLATLRPRGLAVVDGAAGIADAIEVQALAGGALDYVLLGDNETVDLVVPLRFASASPTVKWLGLSPFAELDDLTLAQTLVPLLIGDNYFCRSTTTTFAGWRRPCRGSSTSTHAEPRRGTRGGWGVGTLPTDASGFLRSWPATRSSRQALHLATTGNSNCRRPARVVDVDQLPMEVVGAHVLLASAVPGGETFSIGVNVNGSLAVGLTVAVGGGETSGSASGSVRLAAGDLVTLEASFSAGLASVDLRGIVLRLRLPLGAGLPIFKSLRVPAGGGVGPIFGGLGETVYDGGPGDGGESLADVDAFSGVGWSLIPLQLVKLALAADEVLDADAGMTFQPRAGGADAGPAVALDGGAATTTGVLGATVGVPASVGDLNATKVGVAISGDGAPAISVREAFVYRPAPGFERRAVHASGFAGHLFTSGATAFIPIGSNTFGGVEAAQALPWSAPGAFKGLLAVALFVDPALGDSTITVGLRVNGSTIASVQLTNATPVAFALDADATSAVVEGDLVSLIAATDGPTDNAHRCVLYVATTFEAAV